MRFIIKTLVFLIMLNTVVQANKEKAGPSPLPEISIGKPDAPVLIIDYSSMTCHHCAHFYQDVLPEIQKKYIDPGYVRIIFRDFPGDQVSIKAHQVAWCKGEIKYLDFVKLLYSTQDKWLSASDPIAALKSIVTQNGISAEQFESALKNQDLLDKIIQVRLEGQRKYKIDATPTLIVNAKIFKRSLSLQEIDDILKPILEAKKE
ncbi:MAG: DsbA family protein [Proteobacteria bacterium]|nr:DsbA family protein [Pseudomonadota bacterium]